MSTSILPTIESQLNFYGYTISMIMGNIGNIFIIIIFTRQRQNTCSIYLITSAIVNNLFLTFISFTEIFPFYYLNETIRAFAFCKLRSYLPAVLLLTSQTMIVLACIDRYLITNHRASFRAFSTLKRAKCLIFFSIIFWLLCCSHIAIMTTIINGQCGTFGIYAKIYTIYVLIFVGLIPPIISGIFGCLTYRNMRQRHIRIQPVVQNTNNANISIRRQDRDLLIIVIAEVFVYIITNTPYPLILLEMMISQYIIPNKSVQYSQIESFILTIAFLSIFVNYAAPFYIYLISSKSFRRDFKKLIINIYQKLRRQPIIRVVPRTIHRAII
jgi:hypothetical protein